METNPFKSMLTWEIYCMIDYIRMKNLEKKKFNFYFT